MSIPKVKDSLTCFMTSETEGYYYYFKSRSNYNHTSVTSSYIRSIRAGKHHGQRAQWPGEAFIPHCQDILTVESHFGIYQSIPVFQPVSS